MIGCFLTTATSSSIVAVMLSLTEAKIWYKSTPLVLDLRLLGMLWTGHILFIKVWNVGSGFTTFKEGSTISKKPYKSQHIVVGVREGVPYVYRFSERNWRLDIVSPWNPRHWNVNTMIALIYVVLIRLAKELLYHDRLTCTWEPTPWLDMHVVFTLFIFKKDEDAKGTWGTVRSWHSEGRENRLHDCRVQRERWKELTWKSSYVLLRGEMASSWCHCPPGC